MTLNKPILITGAGIVAPVGVGYEEFAAAVVEGRNGVVWREGYEGVFRPEAIGGLVTRFDGRHYIKPRKAMKVMCREIQYGHAAAMMAVEQSGIDISSINLERFSVIFGGETFQAEPEEVVSAIRGSTGDNEFDFTRWGHLAMKEIQPLWMLKYLPNMAASHISIALNATGPNNTICQGDVSSMLALIEAITLLQRGWADVAVAGGSGSHVQVNCQAGRNIAKLASVFQAPEEASRPFDRNSTGFVAGEGGAALMIETTESAGDRGQNSLAEIAGWARGFCPNRNDAQAMTRRIGEVIELAVEQAGIDRSEVAHVSSSASGARFIDQCEKDAISRVLPDSYLVATKSLFGNMGAGTSVAEIIASLIALQRRMVPPNRNVSEETERFRSAAVTDNRFISVKTAVSEQGQVAAIVLRRGPRN